MKILPPKKIVGQVQQSLTGPTFSNHSVLYEENFTLYLIFGKLHISYRMFFEKIEINRESYL